MVIGNTSMFKGQFMFACLRQSTDTLTIVSISDQETLFILHFYAASRCVWYLMGVRRDVL